MDHGTLLETAIGAMKAISWKQVNAMVAWRIAEAVPQEQNVMTVLMGLCYRMAGVKI